MNEFKTANVKLEQFLFMHNIRFKRWQKNDDLLTEWVYDRTPRLEAVVREYREIWGQKGVA